MSNKQQIKNIKANSERTIQGLETKPQEFVYKRTGGFVKSNQVYSIYYTCLLYTSPSPRDRTRSRMPSSA